MYTLMSTPLEDDFLDCTLWQKMLDQESGCGFAPGACIGVLRREDFIARKGRMLVWQGEISGMRALARDYAGEAGADLAVLLVADHPAVQILQTQGLSSLRALVHRNKLQPYILKTMDQLQAAGLEDFIEELGLMFPKH